MQDMTTSAVDASRRSAARIVGAAYLLAIPIALFAEFYVPTRLIVLSSLADTARNIIEHELLYRLGIAANLAVFALDVVLITALYVALEPVNRFIALLAAFIRVVETAIMVVATLNDVAVLRLLSGVDYMRAFDPAQRNALMRLAIGAHGAGYNAGLLFAGLGSSLFCWLWFKSRLVPRALAALGIVASLVLALRTLAVVAFPELGDLVPIPYWGGPIFIFELTMGFWLLVREIPAYVTSPSERATGAT
jgi:hypothetical protein